MLIEVVNMSMDANNVIDNLQVSNGTQVMNVTPYQVFDAILNGRMQSNTVVLAPLGINILDRNTGNVYSVHIKMTAEQRKLLHQIVGIDEAPERVSAKSAAAKVAEDKQVALDREREAFLERDKIRREQNRAMADAAIQQGLRNLTREERMQRRAEYFKNNRNN